MYTTKKNVRGATRQNCFRTRNGRFGQGKTIEHLLSSSKANLLSPSAIPPLSEIGTWLAKLEHDKGKRAKVGVSAPQYD